jgi:glucose-6-phosphate 1-dehydrogenase
VGHSSSSTFVLFGSTGDLARRKILPALCSLFQKKLLPQNYRLIAFSRRLWNDAQYRAFIRPSLVSFPKEVVEGFLEQIQHVRGTFDNVSSFQTLAQIISSSDALYYVAVQPILYPDIIEKLGKAGLHGKLLIEKPFGSDLQSAQALEALIEKYFLPEHIFRIDHYLGKAGLVAIESYRMKHPEFDARLNNTHVASVTCRIFESLDIQDRGEFYDLLGALLDVGQNHLLEMLATVLMDTTQGIESLPYTRAQALQQLIPISATTAASRIVRAQYDGYRDEADVGADSQVETYVSVTTESTDARWRGVPLVLEGGKALAQKKSEIEIMFKDGTRHLFPMDLREEENAHEAVLRAAWAGDTSRFVSLDEVLASWTFIMSVRHFFTVVPLQGYTKGGSAPSHHGGA